MKRLFSLLLILLTLAGLAACQEEVVHKDILDTVMAVRYRGEAEKAIQLAPQAYWDWYAAQGNSMDELADYSKGIYYSWVNIMSTEFGTDLKVAYTIVSEEALKSDRLEKIAKSLETQFEIDADTVTHGWALHVKETITGSKKSDTQERDYYQLRIGGTDYIVNITEYEGKEVVNFPV